MLLRHINYFLAVAEHGSFTRAAAALFVSQPALSQQIKQLEERLGCQLFDRSGRTTRLTDAGETYRHYALKALEDLETGARALQDVEDLSLGSLRIGMPPTVTAYLAGPVVEAFSRKYPAIKISLNEVSQEQIEQDLLHNQLDLGIAFDDIAHPDLHCTALLDETLALIVNRDHPLASQAMISAAMLADLPLALLTHSFATRTRVDQYLRSQQLTPQVQLETSTLGALSELLRRLPLASLLPASIADLYPELCAIPLENPLARRQVVLVRFDQGYQSAAARRFSEVALSVAQNLMTDTKTAP